MNTVTDLLKIILTSIGSIITLFLLTKLIGNKQMSELNMFDYINGITIGSIAAEMATALDGDFLLPLTAMIIYAASAILLSYTASKSVKLRRFINGRSILLMNNGKLFPKNFTTAKIDLNEFLIQCRIAGFFNIDDIQTAVLEANGKISFLPKADKRPCNPEDLQITVQTEKPCISLILDGKILYENLRYSGKDEIWLNRELEKRHYKAQEIFLAVCDCTNKLSIYVKIPDKPDNDIFE